MGNIYANASCDRSTIVYLYLYNDPREWVISHGLREPRTFPVGSKQHQPLQHRQVHMEEEDCSLSIAQTLIMCNIFFRDEARKRMKNQSIKLQVFLTTCLHALWDLVFLNFPL